ncbi:MAG: ArnT family glycosyltransferase [Nitrospinota bacterium]
METSRKESHPGWLPVRYRAGSRLFWDLFLLALAVRVLSLLPVVWALARGEPAHLGGDWEVFHTWGRDILAGVGMVAGGRPTAAYTPLYPLLVAGVYGVAGESPLAVLGVQTFLGALACPLVAATARHLGGRGGGAVAGLLYALYPPFIRAEGLVAAEALFVFWVIACLWVLVRLERDFSAGGMALLGLFGALGSLTKPSLAVFPFACGGALVVREWVRRGGFWRPIARGLALALVFAAVLSPWVVRNYRAFGRFVPLATEAGAVFDEGIHLKEGWAPGFGAHDEVTARAAKIESEPERSAFLMREALRQIAADPARLPRLLAVKAILFWSPFGRGIFPGGTYSFGFVFLLPFAAYALRRPRPSWRGGGRRTRIGRSGLWPFWGLVAYFFLLGLVFIGSPRLRLPAEAGILLLAALGLVRLLETSRPGAFWTVSGGWLAANVAVFFFSDALRSWVRGVF